MVIFSRKLYSFAHSNPAFCFVFDPALSSPPALFPSPNKPTVAIKGSKSCVFSADPA